MKEKLTYSISPRCEERIQSNGQLPPSITSTGATILTVASISYIAGLGELTCLGNTERGLHRFNERRHLLWICLHSLSIPLRRASQMIARSTIRFETTSSRVASRKIIFKQY